MAKKLKVALIFGGTSKEREVSLMSAKNVEQNIDRSKYNIVRVEVTQKNNWIEKSVSKLKTADVALLAVHGPGGEDGTIQGLLELLDIPYTNSGVLASALAMNKSITKKLVALAGVLVSPSIIISKKDYQKTPKKYLSKLKGKVVIKPNRIGSSIGITITDKKQDIKNGLSRAFEHDDEVLVEKFVQGTEVSVPVLGNINPKALPVIQIVPKSGSKFFDFRAKYTPNFSDEIVPAPIPQALTKVLQESAVLVHELLQCRGVTRSDFIVTNKGEVYFLEINTIPGMTENSLVPKSAKSMGISYSKFLDKLIQLALNKE